MSVIQQTRRVTAAKLLSIVVACAGASGVAACGGSSSKVAQQVSATSTHPASVTPAQSNADTGRARAQTRHGQRRSGGSHKAQKSTIAQPPQSAGASQASHVDTVHGGKVQKARSAPGLLNDDESTMGGQPVNPCRLVSLNEARAITGGPITKAIEAPLGPSCIYQVGGSKANISLMVETLSFAQLTRQLGTPTRVVVSGRTAYCGRLGTHMLLVPLARGQVLNVTAPCAVARRFATLALGRLAA